MLMNDYQSSMDMIKRKGLRSSCSKSACLELGRGAGKKGANEETCQLICCRAELDSEELFGICRWPSLRIVQESPTLCD